MSVAEKGRSKLLLRRMGTGGGERQRQGGEAGCLAVQGSCKRCAPPSPGHPPGVMQPRVGAGGVGGGLICRDKQGYGLLRFKCVSMKAAHVHSLDWNPHLNTAFLLP